MKLNKIIIELHLLFISPKRLPVIFMSPAMYFESFLPNYNYNLYQYMILNKIIKLTQYIKYIVKLPTRIIRITRN